MVRGLWGENRMGVFQFHRISVPTAGTGRMLDSAFCSVRALGRMLSRITRGRSSRIAQDSRLFKKARALPTTEILWEGDEPPAPAKPEPQAEDGDEPSPPSEGRLRAAE